MQPDEAFIDKYPVEYGVMGGCFQTPIYHRDKLKAGHKINGPALIQEYASTTVLVPGDQLVVDQYGNLDIEIETQS